MDCNAVESILRTAESAVEDVSDLYSGKWKALCVKALVRRSAAHAKLGMLICRAQSSAASAALETHSYLLVQELWIKPTRTVEEP